MSRKRTDALHSTVSEGDRRSLSSGDRDREEGQSGESLPGLNRNPMFTPRSYVKSRALADGFYGGPQKETPQAHPSSQKNEKKASKLLPCFRDLFPESSVSAIESSRREGLESPEGGDWRVTQDEGVNIDDIGTERGDEQLPTLPTSTTRCPVVVAVPPAAAAAAVATAPFVYSLRGEHPLVLQRQQQQSIPQGPTTRHVPMSFSTTTTAPAQQLQPLPVPVIAAASTTYRRVMLLPTARVHPRIAAAIPVVMPSRVPHILPQPGHPRVVALGGVPFGRMLYTPTQPSVRFVSTPVAQTRFVPNYTPPQLLRHSVRAEQQLCCVRRCGRKKSKRKLKSMRLSTPDMFKQDYLRLGWTSICHYHYFSQLYMYKKKHDLKVVSNRRRRKK